MQLILCAMDDDLLSAWQQECGALPGVEIHAGSIFERAADALVSPANSFGFMDGGIDLAISEQLGWQVQDRLRALLARDYDGELLVGQAVLVPTDAADFPLLIAAPTMRMPAVLPRDTVNPYLATRAVLRLVQHDTWVVDGQELALRGLIRSVAFPGMGTGIGGVSAQACARQMRQAITDVLLHPRPPPADWDDATDRHLRLLGK